MTRHKIYFNLDLTLTKMDKTFDDVLEDTLRELGVLEEDIDPEEYSEEFFRFFERLDRHPRQKAFSIYFSHRHINIDAEKAAEMYRENELEEVQARENLNDVLDKLKQVYPLGIVTAGTTNLQREKVRKLGVKEYFEDIHITYEEGKTKKQVMEQINENNPQEPVYVSNSDSDIKKARETGWKAVKANIDDLADEPAKEIERRIA